ncbi:class I SAM-dependent methyltransferase [Actinacidiphila yeochonensis]|uniref:class I SAM-dependent methyltransferase n=1 Tax=Actinacidiphila yeochonensis TaxID=89050 RepID=UPI00068E3C76|nr:class I SAM-dependent methyltransferase [Actinacidiphila yeochonensis]
MPESTVISDALEGLRVGDVPDLDFSTLVGLVNEPNMPSGGGRTIRRVIDMARLRPGVRVLEVGSNTGYTSIEFASWIDGEVVGVDVNPVSTAFATEKAARHGLDNVRFDVADGTDLPYRDGTFDLVYCSNVTSFMTDHRGARDEYYRVLAPRGVLAAVPIYYASPPPDDLRRRVGAAIGVDLPVTDQDYWRDLFSDDGSTLIDQETYAYVRQSPESIAAYVRSVLDQPHLARLDARVLDAVGRRLAYFYELFDENLGYARYDILMYRRGHPNPERVLHQSRAVR